MDSASECREPNWHEAKSRRSTVKVYEKTTATQCPAWCTTNFTCDLQWISTRLMPMVEKLCQAGYYLASYVKFFEKNET